MDSFRWTRIKEIHADDFSYPALQGCAGCDSLVVRSVRLRGTLLGPFVRHAQLQLGENIIMLGSVRPADGITSPQASGAATQMLAVYVKDPDAHYERAHAAGAKILYPPTDTDFGSREYHVLDLEGHPWTFGTYQPAVD